jgi:hypothetical protein
MASAATASRSFATICLGLCFFRRRGFIESLLPRGDIDSHTAWIGISNAGHAHQHQAYQLTQMWWLARMARR